MSVSTATVPAGPVYPPKARRLVIILVAMLGTIMTMIDATIANVALPHVRATFGVTQEQINWVLTSFVVSTAVVVPATGFLEQVLGRKWLFAGSLIGFTLSSALAGLAWNLDVLIVSRILQGLTGAAIAPMAQAILYDNNPPEERVRAMTIWSMGVIIAPVLGPPLGGWITENYSWRWVFYINVPIGIAGAIGALLFIPLPKHERYTFDGFGYGLIVIGLTAIQLMLDRGSQLDWFDSNEIWAELAIGVAALWMFLIHTMTAKAPLIPRRVFTDRNFVLACLFTAANSGALMAISALLAPMLQGLYNYGTTDAGLLMMPRGVAMAFSMMTAGWMMKRFGPRFLILLGIIFSASGLYLLTGISP
ncbi:MAG: DHA2 family efflux MFS transporter permease subunit, partial [Alphaproteobacteria bacterium]|nr:DHA2 family efflux MFS transporter permease subunit [Alphaproteobacteria bacterium]